MFGAQEGFGCNSLSLHAGSNAYWHPLSTLDFYLSRQRPSVPAKSGNTRCTGPSHFGCRNWYEEEFSSYELSFMLNWYF
jgi:hypothetical protein